MRFSIQWFLLALIASLLTGCETFEASPPQQQTGSTPAPDQTQSSDTLRVGDRIRVIFIDIPTPPPAVEQVIPEDGKLVLHMGVEYNFAGQNRSDTERKIADIYVKDRKIYTKMTVVIEKQASFISIGGEVRSPSSIVHRGDLTVLSAIDAASGFTEFARRTGVIVTRGNSKKQVIVNAKKAIKDPRLNLPLYPGDSVYVPRSSW